MAAVMVQFEKQQGIKEKRNNGFGFWYLKVSVSVSENQSVLIGFWFRFHSLKNNKAKQHFFAILLKIIEPVV